MAGADATATPTFHTFPKDFETDEYFVHLALAEWNEDHHLNLTFAELGLTDIRWVIQRAQQLKQAEAGE